MERTTSDALSRAILLQLLHQRRETGVAHAHGDANGRSARASGE